MRDSLATLAPSIRHDVPVVFLLLCGRLRDLQLDRLSSISNQKRYTDAATYRYHTLTAADHLATGI